MIIVTGASRGIGKAICHRLISSNIEVLGIARDIKNLSFDAIECDVSLYEDIKKVVTQIKSKNNKILGLINAAGVASMNLAVTTPKDVVTKIINVNLIGSIYFSQLIAPLMMRNKQGSIINFSTIAVNMALKGESIYIASKAGIEGFSRAFAREVSDFNINVNCIAPGPIKTDLIKGVSDKQIKNVVSHQLIPKQFSTDDVCNIVELLLDEKSKSITGQTFYIGGI